MTPQEIAQKWPQAMTEWNRVKSLGDPRSWEQWAADYEAANPGWMQGVEADYYAANGVATPWTQVQRTYTPQELQAIQQFAFSSGEQKAILDSLGGDLTAYGNFVENWWGQNIHSTNPDSSPADAALLQSLGYDPSAWRNEGPIDVPVQEFIGNEALNNYIIPDLEDDALRREWVNAQAARFDEQQARSDALISQIYGGGEVFDVAEYAKNNPDLVDDYNRNALAYAAIPDDAPNAAWKSTSLTDFLTKHYQMAGRAEGRKGTRQVDSLLKQEQAASDADVNTQLINLTEQYDANGRAIQTFTDAERQSLAEQVLARGQNIDTELNSLREAQAPVSAARLNAADAQMSAVNLGLQSQLDGIQGQQALDGYVGDGSGVNSSLARAAITSRQNAAGIRSGAELENASDLRSLNNYGATQRRTLGDFSADSGRELTGWFNNANYQRDGYNSGETRRIKDMGSDRKFSLFSNDINRRVGALTLPASTFQTNLAVRNAADEFSQSGLNRSFRILNNFRTDSPPPMSGGAPATIANTAIGDGIAGIGAGVGNLLGQAALSRYKNPETVKTPGAPATNWGGGWEGTSK